MVGQNILTYKPMGPVWTQDLRSPEGGNALAWLHKRGLEDPIIQEAGLGFVRTTQQGWERFQGALSIPYHDGRGREVGMRFRWAQGERKYDQRSGTPHRLYGIHLIEEPVLYLTEGEFDSLILRQIGLPAIGVPGATGWQDHWRWLFRDCHQVLVAFDGDEAGRKGATEIARSLRDVSSADLCHLPAGKDINELYLEEGAEAVRRALT